MWSVALVSVCLAEPPVPAAPTPPVTATMHLRFNALTEARDHVIAGRLDEAKASAARLKGLKDDGPAADWASWLEKLGAEAERTASAKDLVEAAQGVGAIAQVCGDCHTAHEGGPNLEGAAGIPAQKWEEGQNMALHRWAMDWMWLGLVAQDTPAWQRGAKELDNKPVLFRFEGTPPPTHRPQLEQLVYVLSGLALEAPPEERGTLMGQLIATCTECHVRAE